MEAKQQGPIGAFTLAEEIERFQPGDDRSGRRAETLIKTDRLRVVLITMRAGASLQEHTAPGPITIHALKGRFEVDGGGATADLPAGSLISFEANVRHAVHAKEDGAFLLTISWPGATK
jgi:quercetin dioxygenase-like cupin family protein